MTTIRKFVYATLMAVTALNIAPALASAETPARGKFTLTHEVRWGNARVPAGEYQFSYNPDNLTPVLTLRKIDGMQTGFMLLVTTTNESKPSDLSRLMLESTPDGSYVSAMQLPDCGMTLHFAVPAHAEKQLAKAATTLAAAGQ
ncbi:MAG TPA: hypothetical protein VE377_14470 [Candidatus Dormibacteraeota bacterium]|nr:hypothetical protein [Candidatus Dormibacteraeota bacterium]